MANELVLVRQYENPVPYVVADGTGIEKGALLKLTTGNTAIISSGANDRIAGVAAREKVASDGRTELAAFIRGDFLAYISGGCSAGDALSAAATNTYPNFLTSVANALASGACIVGYALEDATNGQQKLIRVNVGGGGGQIS